MNSFFKVLETVGLVEAIQPQANPSANSQPADKTLVSAAATAVPVTSQPMTQMSAEQAGQIAALDKNAKDRLISVMEADGAPLCEELVSTLETLEDVIPDERSRYGAALKLMTKKGTPVGAILSDYDKCLGALDESFRVFEAETKEAIQRKVGLRQSGVNTIEDSIQEKTQQIAALQEQIVGLQVKKDLEEIEILKERSKIDLVQDRFVLVYKALRLKVEEHRTKILSYGNP